MGVMKIDTKTAVARLTQTAFLDMERARECSEHSSLGVPNPLRLCRSHLEG